MPRSQLDNLTITLTNDIETAWITDPDDHGFAIGWLTDEAGNPHGSNYSWSSGYQVLPSLDPGASAQVPLGIGGDLSQLPAGTYRLETIIPSMNLRGEPATIEITGDAS